MKLSNDIRSNLSEIAKAKASLRALTAVVLTVGLATLAQAAFNEVQHPGARASIAGAVKASLAGNLFPLSGNSAEKHASSGRRGGGNSLGHQARTVRFALGTETPEPATSYMWEWGITPLGLNNLRNSTVPIKETTLTDVKSVAYGTMHTVALKTDGTVWAWGTTNRFGQLGNASVPVALEGSSVPVRVGTLTGIKSVAANQEQSLAITSTGSVVAWGDNSFGQLGDGTTASRSLPVAVANLSNIAQVAAGVRHSLAVDASGAVWAWGENSIGQIGDNTVTNRARPVKLTGISDVKKVQGGSFHSVALKTDGTVWAWGNNGYAELGTGDTTAKRVPTKITSLTGITDISCMSWHTLALKDDGTVWAWGYNNRGQLGNGSTDLISTVPVQVTGLTGVTAISAGSSQSMALKNDGSVWAWGIGVTGELGNGSKSDSHVPVQVWNLSGATFIAAGASRSAALSTQVDSVPMAADDLASTTKNGTLTIDVLANDYDGDGDALTVTDVGVPAQGGTVRINSDNTVTYVPVASTVGSDTFTYSITTSSGQTASATVTVSINENGNAVAWGSNVSAQLGDGTFDNSNRPLQVPNLTKVKALAGGWSQSLALKNDGTVWGWGKNDDSGMPKPAGGSTGTSTYDRLTPTQVPNLSSIQAISAGTTNGFALKNDGTVWAWGYNEHGELGLGFLGNGIPGYTVYHVLIPRQVLNLTNIRAISSGGAFSLALKSDGTVWAWGVNSAGQLGNNTTTSSAVPVQVTGLTDVKAIGAGSTSSMALKNDGTVVVWGRGTNTIFNTSSVPVPVSGLSGVTAIYAGSSHRLALKSDGTVWAWGTNTSGELGNGSVSSAQTIGVDAPAQVTGLTNVTAISAGFHHSMALKADGTVWVWGDNSFGQLGANVATVSAVPLQVSSLGGIELIAAGSNHCLAVHGSWTGEADDEDGLPGASGTWHEDDNWADGTAPQAQELATIMLNGTYTVVLDSYAEAAGLKLGSDDTRNGEVSLDLDGNTLSVTGAADIGASATLIGWGTLDGDVACAGDIHPTVEPEAEPLARAARFARAQGSPLKAQRASIAGRTPQAKLATIQARSPHTSISKSLTLKDTSQITLDIGCDDESQYSRLTVGQTFARDGVLKVNLTGGFSPAPNQSFELIRCASFAAGTSFDRVELPTASGVRLQGSVISNYFGPGTESYVVQTIGEPPVVAISAPGDQSIVSSLSQIAGTASDNHGNAVASVTVSLRRASDNKFWNGTGWDTADAPLSAVINGTTWSLSAGLPGLGLDPASQLIDGGYTVLATSHDAAGNDSPTASIGLTLDSVAPSVEITSPVDGLIALALPVVRGTAADNAAGSGLAGVSLTLSRASDGKFWNGTAWGTPEIPLAAEVTGSSWTKTTGWPATGTNAATQLLDGNYTLTAVAIDKAGLRSTPPAVSSFIIDRAGPGSVVISSPTDLSVVSSLNEVTGTATDNASGIARVALSLWRNNDGKYWNSGAWATTDSPLTAVIAGSAWSVSTGLPATGTNVATDLLDGRYTLIVNALDKAGNKSAPVRSNITVDHGAPASIEITTPVDASAAQTLPVVRGTVADNAGGSGIARVDVTLLRASDAKYWNGSAWSTAEVPLAASVGGTAWAKTTGLPLAGTNAATQLIEGNYRLSAVAYDWAGLHSATPAVCNFTIDRTIPTALAISTPSNASIIGEFTAVTGTASDNPGGSGIGRVTVSLYRVSDGKYWNGAGWATQDAPMPAVITGGAWSLNAGLPAGGANAATDLVDGLYTLVACAYDNAGNKTAAVRSNFAYDRVAPPTVTITTPVDSSAAQTLTAVRGSAADNVGGSGIARVDVTLSRASDAKFWNGAAWGTEQVALTTVVSGATWARTTGLPAAGSDAATQLIEGNYTLAAVAYDKAGLHSATPAVSNFTIDRTIPDSVGITTPADLSFVSSLDVVTGTASDNPGGSGIGRVTVSLWRVSDGKYWNGATWAAADAPLSAVVTGGTWSLSAGSPKIGTNAATDLLDGRYILVANAYDKVGNRCAVAARSNITVDSGAPASVVITTPVNGSAAQTLAAARGTAADNIGGSGIVRVDLNLQRASDQVYWTGTAWGAEQVALTTVVSGAMWARTTGLPAAGSDAATQLTEGNYTLTAVAYDKAGSHSAAVSSFNIDRTVPTNVAISSPADLSTTSSLTEVTGTANDNPGGSGIGRVTVSLYRVSDGKYWNGATWAAADAPLSAVVTGGTWSLNAGLPAAGTNAATELLDGRYTLVANAYDRIGYRCAVAARSNITVDSGAPASIVISTPVDGSAAQALAAVRGTAADNVGGSGIARVDVTLSRAGDAKFWNGAAWGTEQVALTTVVSGATWARTAGLPAAGSDAATQVVDGNYTLAAVAYDRAGSHSATPAVSSFIIDHTNPANVTISSPADLSTTRSLTEVTGTASDNPGGSGIARVTVSLYRVSDGKYWNGATWAAADAPLSAVVTGGTWNLNAGLPAAGTNAVTELLEGRYTLVANAYDRVGNRCAVAARSNITFKPAAPSTLLARQSNVLLSSVAANQRGVVQLVFTGAVSANTATDVTRFQVNLGGEPLLVQSAERNGSSIVVLGLDDGAVHAGDKLIVTYSVKDTLGQPVQGKAAVTVH